GGRDRSTRPVRRRGPPEALTPAAFVGVDLGGTQIRAGFAHDPSRLESRFQTATPTTNSRDVVRAMVDAVRAAAKAGVVNAVGVGAPGPLDFVEGIVHEAPNLPGFKEVAISRDIGAALGVPVFLDRDTVVAAYAEAAFGAARGVREWIYITVSTGIGGTIVTNGQVLRGVSGTSGEIGHFPVDPNGPLCGCGNVGHVEALASGANLAKQYGVASAAEVFAAWRRGDPKATAIIERARRGLGDMAAGVVNLLNPARIVVGGGIAAGEPEFVLGAMREAVRERAFAA